MNKPARLALCLVGLLVIAEALCRWLIPPLGHESGLHRPHPRRFWTLNGPGWCPDSQAQCNVYINSLSLCNEEITGPRADLTLLLLGDSCTYGAGVVPEERLDRHLERLLSQVTGKQVRVYNGACPGYSSYQSLDLLREVVGTVQPDIVVCASFFGDRGREIMQDKERQGGPAAATVRTWLWKSRVYLFLRARLLDLAPDDDGFFLRNTAGEATVRVTVQDYKANLTAIATTARAHGARHVVYVLPPNLNTRDSGRDNGHRGAAYDVGESEGLIVDGNVLWPDAKERRPYLWDQIHFNAEGCRRFARTLVDVFVAKGLVSPRSAAAR